MDRDEVLRIFCRFAELSELESTEFTFMCETAADNVEQRIRPGADISGYGGRLALAAAALAYYRYVLWSITGTAANEIRVGELSRKSDAARQLEAAEGLCRSAFDDIWDITQDNDFMFEGI